MVRGRPQAAMIPCGCCKNHLKLWRRLPFLLLVALILPTVHSYLTFLPATFHKKHSSSPSVVRSTRTIITALWDSERQTTKTLNVSSLQQRLQLLEEDDDVPQPTPNGGYTHTALSKAKIAAANKGKIPWNKGQPRSEHVKAKIAQGVRASNRRKFLQKLQQLGLTEPEYEGQQRQQKQQQDDERQSRKTDKGGYRPTEETKQKIRDVLKAKYATGHVRAVRTVDPTKVRRGFTHSAETKAKIATSLKQRWANDETYRANMLQQTTKANTNMETRRKISESLKKKWQDEEFRMDMLSRFAKRKRPDSPRDDEHREKISEAMRAKWQEEGYRTKTLEAISKRKGVTPSTTTRSLSSAKNPTQRSRSPVAAKKPKLVQAEQAKMVVEDKPLRTSTKKKKRKVSEVAVESNIHPGMKALEPRTEPREPTRTTGKTTTTTTTKRASKSVKKQASPKNLALHSLPSDFEHVDSIEAVDPESGSSGSSGKANGSVDQLRMERRDLYDLLYGEDETAASTLEDENLESFDPYGLEDF